MTGQPSHARAVPGHDIQPRAEATPGGGAPRVSIGLPVYNGEPFLAAALDSLLAQEFTDFEVIVCDNASTDRTPEICRAYAERDPRIHYHRNPENIGAAGNYNKVFGLARGAYFKWMAHDDLLEPEYLRRCVEVLDAAPPSVVLCFPRRVLMDAQDRVLRRCVFVPRRPAAAPTGVPGAAEIRDLRFTEMICLENSEIPPIVFGLMRTEVLRRTGLIGRFIAADLVLVAEMCLRGQVWQVPEFLFRQRLHARDSWRAKLSKRGEAAWFDPANQRRAVLFPLGRLFVEYCRAIARTDLPWGRRVVRYGQLVLLPASRLRRAAAWTIWRAWSTLSFQAMVLSNRTLLPLRLWALARLMRGADRWRPDRALARVGRMTDEELLCSMARSVLERNEPRGHRLLAEWLRDPMDARRIAAAEALQTESRG